MVRDDDGEALMGAVEFLFLVEVPVLGKLRNADSLVSGLVVIRTLECHMAGVA